MPKKFEAIDRCRHPKLVTKFFSPRLYSNRKRDNSLKAEENKFRRVKVETPETIQDFGSL